MEQFSQARTAREVSYNTRRHTDIVGWLKWGISIVAVGLSALVIAWPLMYSGREHMNLTFANIEVKEFDRPKMIHPRFQGTDEQGQHYNIVAEEAEEAGEKKVKMKNMKGDMKLSSGVTLTLVAAAANADLGTRQAQLSGNVTFTSSDGYEFVTEAVDVDMQQQVAVGNQEIRGKGPMGTLRADRFEMHNNAGEIVFYDHVKLVIEPNKMKDPGVPGPATPVSTPETQP